MVRDAHVSEQNNKKYTQICKSVWKSFSFIIFNRLTSPIQPIYRKDGGIDINNNTTTNNNNITKNNNNNRLVSPIKFIWILFQKEKLRILYSQRTLRGSDGKKARLYGENEAALGQ